MTSTDAAKEQAGQLAGTTKDEARHVADEAKVQARNVLDDARSMVDEQSRTQRDRFVETVRSLSGDLEQMADNGPQGLAGDLARQAADKARHLGERMDGREPADLLDDVRDFARRRPGTFLLSAFAAGVVFGRVARSAKDARSSDERGAGGHGHGTDLGLDTSTRTAAFEPAPDPTAGTTAGIGTGYGTGTAGTGTGEVPGVAGAGYATGTSGLASSDAAEVTEESGYSSGGLGTSNTGTQAETEYGVGTTGTSSDTPLGDEAERRTL